MFNDLNIGSACALYGAMVIILIGHDSSQCHNAEVITLKKVAV